jgi:hypothetical protein
MAKRPQDITDLYLAPVALGLDAALEELAALEPAALEETVALRANVEPRTEAERRRAVVGAVTHFVELHGWSVELVERGLELSHDGNRLVLGVPAGVRAYVDRTP